jgi:hypothetical protein
MFWRSKPKPKQESHIAFLHEKKAAPNPEGALSEALSEYQSQYYEKVSKALDNDAEEAKRVVREARKFIEESRLGYSICRPVFEHVKHWPSWSERDDFEKWCTEPFRYLSGSETRDKPATTVVSFAYNSRPYTLRFVDEGMSAWAEDSHTYGKLELRSGDSLVLGLDVSLDVAKGDLAHWWPTNVYAFVPGPWMKDLVEMAAHIDGMQTQKRMQFTNEDALIRAKGIKLPG